LSGIAMDRPTEVDTFDSSPLAMIWLLTVFFIRLYAKYGII